MLEAFIKRKVVFHLPCVLSIVGLSFNSSKASFQLDLLSVKMEREQRKVDFRDDMSSSLYLDGVSSDCRL